MIEAKDLKAATELYISDKDIVAQASYLQSSEEAFAIQIGDTRASIRKAVRLSNWEAVVIYSKSLEEQTIYFKVYEEMARARYEEASAELDRQAGRVSA